MQCRLLLCLAGAVLTLAFAPVPFPRAQPGKENIDGRWGRVELHNGGRLFPERPGAVELVIAKGTATFFRLGKMQTRWALTLDPKKNPSRFEMKGLDDSRGSVLAGVYRIEGDTLTFAYAGGGMRAVDFNKSRPGVFLTVYRRTKP